MNADRAAEPSALPDLTAADLEWSFRTVSHDGVRRGLRLERLYWDVLKKMAAEAGISLGALVADVAAGYGTRTNLSSALRAVCLKWTALSLEETGQLASMRTVIAIITACPSPAFVLSSARRIEAFNQPFQFLIRRQLPASSPDEPRQDLKLALDLNIVDMLERMKRNRDAPLVTGFVMGLRDQRYRGQLTAVLAPVRTADLLIAFVTR